MQIRTLTDIQRRAATEGFTVAEVVVTMVILSIFLFSFFQGYLVLESQRVFLSRSARASDIAYSNLRKVPTRPTQITAQVCSDNAAAMDLTTGSQSSKPGLDITQYGYVLEPSSSVQGMLGSTATQTLVAYAPYGCSALTTSPLEIAATVTFGTTKVTHATFVQ